MLARCNRMIRILTVTAASMCATTAVTAYQDLSDYTGVYVETSERWRAHLVNVPVGSTYSKVELKRVAAISASQLEYQVGLRSIHDLEILGGEKTVRALKTVEATRGDRPSHSRQLTERRNAARVAAMAAPAKVASATAFELPTAAALKTGVDNLLSEARDAAKVAVAAVDAKTILPKPIVIASVAPAKTSRTDVARGKADVRGSLSAYAPAAVEQDDPFDAVLAPDNSASGVEVPVAGTTPTRRPDYNPVAEANKPIKSRIQLAKGDHKWAARALPTSQFSSKARKCLAEGIYFEARGESQRGQAAVAQVIVNRVKNPAFPDSICGVVYHNKHRRNACQFSFACDGIRDRIASPKSWRVAKRIADDMIDGKEWLREVGSSSHYHANYVSPRWARKMKRMKQIGKHIFYRTYKGGWS